MTKTHTHLCIHFEKETNLKRLAALKLLGAQVFSFCKANSNVT